MTHSTQESANDDDGWEWAIVEIMGHRRHAGRTREVERFGAKMIRIDVPNKGDSTANGWTTHFYPSPALFSFTPSDETTVLRMNKPYGAPARLTYARPDDNADAEGDQDDIPFDVECARG